MTLPPGTRLGPYEVLGPLGSGGMGEVYRASDPRLGRDVAVKVLPDRLSADRGALSRFEREARSLAALSHPNLLGIFDLGREGQVAYVVTELLEGETLRARLLRSELRWQEAVEIGISLADGLSAAHSRGVIHRDLKPENIFLTSDGVVKILDFGLARRDTDEAGGDKTLETASMQTEPGTVMGTAGYMSPEQVTGSSGDRRSDIFSLGCVLYEMAIGRRAFSGRTGAETMAAILKEEPSDPLESGRVLPGELVRIITHCIEKSPDRRFQNARDLSFALKAVAAGGSGMSLPPVPAVRRLRLAVPILVLLTLLAGLVYTVLSRPRAASPARVRSLAVLPLRDIGHDPEQEYFAEGMTDELIAYLAKIGNLRVISRTSVMQYKDSKKTLPQIARELNVDTIVEGSVLRSGDRVRITVELIEASTDNHLWAESYERELSDVLSLQREAALAIAHGVQVKLSPQQEANLPKAGPVNAEAYQAYLKGRYHWYRFTPEDYEKALDSFNTAIEKDPNYALAYAGIAETYTAIGFEGLLPPREAFARARAASNKALELDSSRGEVHAPLAEIRWGEWDWNGALQEFRTAIALSPSLVPTRRYFSQVLRNAGRWDEAFAEMKQALDLDPISPETTKSLGALYHWARRYDRAVELYKKAIELDPNFIPAHEFLSDVYARQRKYKEATEEEERALTLSGDTETAKAFRRDFEKVGYEGAIRVLYRKRLESYSAAARQTYVSPMVFAYLYSLLGEKEPAFEWLEKAFNERSPWLIYMKNDPDFDNIRSDPRFADLQRRVGLP
jgi:eukaryotic-like serine/threonine-protein kinase